MTQSEEIVDSPVGWVSRHIREYLETGGRRGHRKWGMDCLLLITRGRRTGVLRRTALFYGRDGDRYVVIGSSGGQAADPSWVLNLRADPVVGVQVLAETFAARARIAGGVERERLWRLMADLWPEYERYRASAARAGREIPVVVLER
jgi:deazaflavin-dependent oxidoreductase (nitroreductase family)